MSDRDIGRYRRCLLGGWLHTGDAGLHGRRGPCGASDIYSIVGAFTVAAADVGLIG
jgi:hypothetical protein